jgi:protein Mpv17
MVRNIPPKPVEIIRSIPMHLGLDFPANTCTFNRFLWLGNNFNYSSKVLSVAVKVCVQQAVFTPIFNTYFFGMQAALTGESFPGVIERIAATVPTSIVNSLKLWPAVTAVTFAFVMPQYRFMFSGIFAVCWQAYLSFLNRREEKKPNVETEKDSKEVIRSRS